MNIRAAELRDAEQISRLSVQLGYETTTDEIKNRMVKIQNSDNAVFIMESDAQKIVGWIHVHGRHLLEIESYAEIGGLVVDIEFRRQRIGVALMNKAEEWARNSGYSYIRPRSGGTRKEAHMFYEQIGNAKIKWQEVFEKDIRLNVKR